MHDWAQLFLDSGLAGVRDAASGVDKMEAMKKLAEAQRDLRWKGKSLMGVKGVGGLAMELAEGEGGDEFMSAYKPICYNTAAFCWTGWGDEDMEVMPEDEEYGWPFAELNLELARRLHKPDLAQGRALWLVGAYHLTAKRTDKAEMLFAEASVYARRGKSRGEELLSQGYGELARGDVKSLKLTLKDLGKVDDGEFFVGQIETAAKVIGVSI